MTREACRKAREQDKEEEGSEVEEDHHCKKVKGVERCRCFEAETIEVENSRLMLAVDHKLYYTAKTTQLYRGNTSIDVWRKSGWPMTVKSVL